nr:serine/threonine-protein phosphatase [Delftia sp. PS-11]
MIVHFDGPGQRYGIQVASASFRGSRSSNEDAMGILSQGSQGLCCTLADGAGGHGHGELAAQLTVQAVLEGFRDNPLFAPASLASLISQAEHKVCGQQTASVSRMHMSATVVVLCLDVQQGRALWAHWGDSRLYLFRKGRVHVCTQDHSIVQQLLHAGLYEEADPRRLPNRNVLAGAIGAEGQVPPTVRADALVLEPGDVFLLCSDGLWEDLHETQMESLLARSRHPDEWIQRMVEHVASLGNPHQDNLSALTAWVQARETNE